MLTYCCYLPSTEHLNSLRRSINTENTVNFVPRALSIYNGIKILPLSLISKQINRLITVLTFVQYCTLSSQFTQAKLLHISMYIRDHIAIISAIFSGHLTDELKAT